MSVFRRLRKGVRDEHYSIKFTLGGVQTLIKTGFTTKEDALKLEAQIVAELKAGRIPNLLGQLKRRHSATISQLITDYLEAGCPDKKRRPRTGLSLEREKSYLVHISEWWGKRAIEGIAAADCHDYAEWRRTTVRAGSSGDRTAELEIGALRNCLHWSLLTRRIAKFPFPESMPRFRNSADIQHCRDFMPASGDELHRLAAAFFTRPGSQVLGGQLLCEAFTGCRTSEVLDLRWDAKRIGVDAEPGYMDDRHLWINRRKRGINGYIPITPHLRAFLTAWRAWHRSKFPESHYWFPASNGQSPVDKGSLTHALKQITAQLKLPHRTSHGLRAYYVTVRRSEGISDAQIASELGQRSGAALIVSTYGAVPPNWSGGAELTWLPRTGAPAWDLLQKSGENIIPLSAAG